MAYNYSNLLWWQPALWWDAFWREEPSSKHQAKSMPSEKFLPNSSNATTTCVPKCGRLIYFAFYYKSYEWEAQHVHSNSTIIGLQNTIVLLDISLTIILQRRMKTTVLVQHVLCQPMHASHATLHESFAKLLWKPRRAPVFYNTCATGEDAIHNSWTSALPSE